MILTVKVNCKEAYALARSVFPSLTNQSFAFHTDALPISGGEWVEVPAVSWRALRPALSSLVIHLSKDHTAELQKDEEEVNLSTSQYVCEGWAAY